jgi:hypothetical protein
MAKLVGRAGGSARAQYTQLRRRARRHLAHAALAALACGIAVRTGAPRQVALLVAAWAVFNFARALWARRQSTEAWRIGAEGEEATAADLAPLERRGFVVLHDWKPPGSRANIDHIVVGPTGVFTIETKNYGGVVYFRRRLIPWRVTASCNGRDLAHVVEQAHWQAASIASLLAETSLCVAPVVVVQRAELTSGWFARRTTEGVHWCRGDEVARFLRTKRAGTTPLSPDEVLHVADAIEHRRRVRSAR